MLRRNNYHKSDVAYVLNCHKLFVVTQPDGSVTPNFRLNVNDQVCGAPTRCMLRSRMAEKTTPSVTEALIAECRVSRAASRDAVSRCYLSVSLARAQLEIAYRAGLELNSKIQGDEHFPHSEYEAPKVS